MCIDRLTRRGPSMVCTVSPGTTLSIRFHSPSPMSTGVSRATHASCTSKPCTFVASSWESRYRVMSFAPLKNV